MMKSSVEADLMNGVVERLGGQRIDQLTIDRSLAEADYFFRDHRTIIELKTLEVDQVKHPDFIKKMSDLYMCARKAGATKAIAFGTVNMSSEHFNEEYQRLILEAFAIPIDRVVSKAAKQIASTAKALAVERPIGVLMLVNTEHTAITPGHVPYLLSRALGKNKHPEINEVFYVTLDLPAVTGDGYEFDTWLRWKRSDLESVPDDLERQIVEAWMERNQRLKFDSVPRSDYDRMLAAKNLKR